MGSKNNPGKFDCYHAAEPDEPMFVLLARDPLAPFLVSIWAAMRNGADAQAVVAISNRMMETCGMKYAIDPDTAKVVEALECSSNMFAWRKAHRNAGPPQAGGTGEPS